MKTKFEGLVGFAVVAVFAWLASFFHANFLTDLSEELRSAKLDKQRLEKDVHEVGNRERTAMLELHRFMGTYPDHARRIECEKELYEIKYSKLNGQKREIKRVKND